MSAPVRILCAPLEGIDARPDGTLLAEADLERLGTLTRAQRRREYLAGRALLRLALERHNGLPAKLQRLRNGANGKPESADGTAISVAHSGGLVACAVASAGPIGVDLEQPRRRATAGIAQRFFSPREAQWCGQAEDRFYMLWVLKEAYLKATGAGLAGGLASLQCVVAPPHIEARAVGVTIEPALALYRVGTALLGVAAPGGALEARVERVGWPLGGPAVERIAASG